VSKELEKTWQLLEPEPRPGHYEVAYMVHVSSVNGAYLRLFVQPSFAAAAGLAPGDWLSLRHDGRCTLQLRKGMRCEAARKLCKPKGRGRLLHWEIKSTGAVGAIFGQERTPVQRMERVAVGDGVLMFRYHTAEDEEGES